MKRRECPLQGIQGVTLSGEDPVLPILSLGPEAATGGSYPRSKPLAGKEPGSPWRVWGRWLVVSPGPH